MKTHFRDLKYKFLCGQKSGDFAYTIKQTTCTSCLKSWEKWCRENHTIKNALVRASKSRK